MTPLHLAAGFGRREIVILLLVHSGDKNPADKDGFTPLHFAALNGHLEIVKLLLGHAKDKNPAGETPLHDAAYG
jgi:ankyrin repeat protein